VKIALVRGSLLRGWELANYEFEWGRPDVMVSRGLRAMPPAERFRLRRFPSPADIPARLGPRAAGAVDLTLGSLEYLAGLERALAGYDLVHALELSYPFSLQAVRARRRGACRAVVATVMDNIAFRAHPNRHVARRAHRVARGVDRFLAITERARLHLWSEGVPDERITVLPLGTDTNAFRPRDSPRRDGPPRVLCVARLEPAKGVEDLVVAGGLLARRGLDFRLSFVGAGPRRGRLAEIACELGIADRLTIMAVPWPELPPVYRDHDVFVLGSAPTQNWREQFGFAVIEAMASGLPVRVGDSGSLPEVVGRPECLVRPHDPMALADALEPLLTDLRLREQEGSLSRARAVEQYDQREIRARIETVYREVLDESGT
jgi:glycosyltransferase involved in cell wall biosynthesis